MSSVATEGRTGFENAGWFPVDLHVPGRRYGFLSIDEDIVGRSSFLDTRIEARLDAAQPVPVTEIPDALPQAPVAWLFHTSFCGSTLAARALHLPPFNVCLREPLVLRRLADARHQGESITELLAPTLRLLRRPWHPGGSVLIKPTHAALNIAADLLAVTPASRAVILTSSLEDFLISNLKKTPESQAKIPALAERALQASTLTTRLAQAALQPPDLLAAAALQWAAQRELAVDVIGANPERVRLADMDWLLADLGAAAVELERWLRLQLPHALLQRQAGEVALRNAKATESAYGADQRVREALMVADLYRVPLDHARAWAERHLFPSMRAQALQNPQPWVVH